MTKVKVSVGAGLWLLDSPLVLYREAERERVVIVIRGGIEDRADEDVCRANG